MPRDELADALWGGAPPATRIKALSVIASKLRGLLADSGMDEAVALKGGFGCYRLELPEGTWVDVLAARRASDAAEEAFASGETVAAKREATLAESLTRQPFLPGDDGAWVEATRRELAGVRAHALSVLTDACLRLREAFDATRWAEQVVALEPFREAGYRRLMEAHVAAGNRAEALQVYDRCRRLLADELGAYPSPETEAVYRALLERPPVQNVAAADSERVPSRALDVEADTRRRPLLGVRRALLGVATAASLATVTTVALGVVGFRSHHGRGLASLSPANAVVGLDASGRQYGSASIEASPGAVALGDGSEWVTMANQDSVSRIDPSTNTVKQTIEVGDGPAAIAVGGGFVWVANSLDGTISEIDPRRNGGTEIAKRHVGNGPTGIAFGLGGIWVANSVDRTVVRVDPLTGAADDPIAVDAGADAIAVGDGAVWVTSEAAGVLSKIDPRDRAVVTITNVGSQPVAIAASPGAVWVANSGDGTVSRVDASTSRVTAAIPAGTAPNAIAVAPNGRTIWVSDELEGTLKRLDASTGTVLDTIKVGELPQAVAAGRAKSFVALPGVGAAHRGGTLRVANLEASSNAVLLRDLDPASGGSGMWEVLSLTNDGLLGYARTGGAQAYRVVPDLATSLPAVSDGGRTYVFHLRRGVRYSTGGVVQPADIRRGIERALAVGGSHPPNSYLGRLVGATACIARPPRCDLTQGIVTSARSSTVTFHLTAPDPDFPYKLALPIADAVPAGTPLLNARLPLPATGPYRMTTRAVSALLADGVLRLARNPRFAVWSAAVQPDGVPDRIVESFHYTGTTLPHSVASGAADVARIYLAVGLPPSVLASLRTRYSSQLHDAPLPGLDVVSLNTRVPPFNDVRARRALNYAVDRDHMLVLAGGEGVSQIGCQILPPNVEGYRPYCPYTAAPNAAGTYSGPDLAKARELVAASGTSGQTVTAWFYDSRATRLEGAYVVSVLRSIGYRAHLKLVNSTTYASSRQAMMCLCPYLAYPSPDAMVSALLRCGAPQANFNQSGFCDRRIDHQVDRARTLEGTDRQAADRLWAKVDRELTLAAPWVVTQVPQSVELLSRRTGNYTYCFLSYGACLDQLWVR